MELWCEMNDVVEREFKDEIELEFKDEVELDNLFDQSFYCKEMETNNEIAVENFFEQFVEARNDEEEILTVEEVLKHFESDKTEASNDEEETLTEEIFKQLVESEKTEASSDEETRCREKKTETIDRIIVETSEKTNNEETLIGDLIKTNEIVLKSDGIGLNQIKLNQIKSIKLNDEDRIKRRRVKENERVKKWSKETKAKERVAFETVATFVPNLRGKKKRTRLEILEDVIHYFNTCHSS